MELAETRADERARIVAWLRLPGGQEDIDSWKEYADSVPPSRIPAHHEWLADRISRGEHEQ